MDVLLKNPKDRSEKQDFCDLFFREVRAWRGDKIQGHRAYGFL